ncbi:MAG: hypothetical protein J7521_12390 [Caulobacter sp.]|nr:hypothetical protein [Caulobacter sp.]
MSRRAVAVLLTLAALAATAGCASDRSTAPDGYAWSYLDNPGEGPKLAYGRPDSDDVLLMLNCGEGPAKVTLTATGLSGRQIALASGRTVTRLPARAIASQAGQGVLEARTSTDAAALSAFRRTGALDLLVASERHGMPARDGEHARVKAFFKACSA